MSGQPRGRLWVDPEGVVHLGDSYAEHGALYEGYLTQLEQLRSRYGKSWGDDDMGQAFSVKFLQGLDALDGIVGNVKATLDFTSEGLRQGGKLYRDADDQAGEMSNHLAGTFDDLSPGVFNRRALTETPVEPTQLTTPLARHAVQAPLAGETLEGQPRFRKSVRPGSEDDLVPFQAGTLNEGQPKRRGTLRRPLESGENPPLRSRLLEPGENPPLRGRLLPEEAVELSEQRPTGQLTSAAYIDPGWAGARIDGVPLADGYRLQAFIRLPDGTTCVDANLYQSISPVTPAVAVTDANGQPVDAGKGSLFVVRDNPSVDPLAPGYEPFYVSFTPDGTAVPIVTGF